MKFGIVPINLQEFTNPEVLIPFVQQAEALGYESVWTAEHVIIPTAYTSVYPYNPSGKLPFPPDAPIIDPLVVLTFIAATTTRLRLGTGVNILPQMNPLYLAKWASSLDHLSYGRLMLGVGIGWLRKSLPSTDRPRLVHLTPRDKDERRCPLLRAVCKYIYPPHRYLLDSRFRGNDEHGAASSLLSCPRRRASSTLGALGKPKGMTQERQGMAASHHSQST
ncbi:MAG: LLM class flavin-dependent oxidoreductase [Deltaproteobacteria bacterium]|nr:LLM class flavin-dependent oxidoreductase [Deltaproteobacteria bacterium]